MFHFTYIDSNPSLGFFKYGVTGVDFFFLISGFVIFISIKHSSSAGHFLLKRFIRLFPAYVISVLLVGTLVLLLDNQVSLNAAFTMQWLTNFTMAQKYFGFADLDASYWTLTVEWIFYLLMAVLLKFKAVKNLPQIIRLAIPLLVFYDLLVSKYLWDVFLFSNEWIPLLPHLPVFLIGVLFYEIIEGRDKVINYYAIALLFIVQVLFFENGGKSMHVLTTSHYAGVLALYIGLFALFVQNRLAFLNHKVLIFLGAISYPFYLVQQRMTSVITLNLVSDKVGNTVLLFLIHFAIIFALTMVVYHASEKLTKWASKKLL